MKKYYLLHLLSKTILGIFYSCSVVNMTSGGMSIRQACFAFFCLSLFISLFEIPFGFIADKFGRKRSVLMGLASYCIGFGVFAYSNTLFTVSMAFVALGTTLVSGADKAWFVSQFELLPDRKGTTETLFLNLSLVERGAMIVGAFIGPYFMVRNPAMVWGVTSLVAFIGLFYGLFLPDHHRLNEKKSKDVVASKLDMGSILKGASFSFFVLLFANFFSGFAEGGKGIVIQPYIMAISGGFVGILTIHQLLCVVFRFSGILFYKRYLQAYAKGPQFVALSTFFMFLSSVVALSTESYLVFIIFFGLSIFALGWGEPLMDSTINDKIKNSKLKATYFSMNSMFINIGEGLSLLYLSFVLTKENMAFMGWGIAAVGFLVSVFVFSGAVVLRKRELELEQEASITE
jgi:MFS family permease